MLQGFVIRVSFGMDIIFLNPDMGWVARALTRPKTGAAG